MGRIEFTDTDYHIKETGAGELAVTDPQGDVVTTFQNDNFDVPYLTGTKATLSDRAHISGSVPALQLEGTETNGENLSIRENAGSIELYDETAAATALTWDLAPALENASIAQVDQSRDLLPEAGQTGQVADATGVQYTGQTNQNVDSWLLNDERTVYVEGATASSAGDEVVDVEVYDPTAAVVVGSVSITGGSKRARSTDISASLTAGNDVYVRFNVTTASATAGATFDALAARLIIE